jgi:hypothetical protein
VAIYVQVKQTPFCQISGVIEYRIFQLLNPFIPKFQQSLQATNEFILHHLHFMPVPALGAPDALAMTVHVKHPGSG